MIRLGLIGAGIGPSRSPAMHEATGRALGLACSHERFDLDALGLGVADLPVLVADLERRGFAGFNVTHPCMQAIIPPLSGCSPEARELGALNTVVLRSDRLRTPKDGRRPRDARRCAA